MRTAGGILILVPGAIYFGLSILMLSIAPGIKVENSGYVLLVCSVFFMTIGFLTLAQGKKPQSSFLWWGVTTFGVVLLASMLLQEVGNGVFFMDAVFMAAVSLGAGFLVFAWFSKTPETAWKNP